MALIDFNFEKPISVSSVPLTPEGTIFCYGLFWRSGRSIVVFGTEFKMALIKAGYPTVWVFEAEIWYLEMNVIYLPSQVFHSI